ncbi:MAG TPA: 50S ribosomal protein L10 [archaeon]|nr:50S ribosomal protein L10 [archaeon]
MVSEKKKRDAKEVGELVSTHRVVGMLDMHKLPAKQLYEMRKKLKGHAKIRVLKKRVISIVLSGSKLQGVEQLAEKMHGEPGMLFSNENPFRLAVMLNESKSMAFAKPGDTAPHDIEIKAGPTSLPVGPAIGELQRLKIPAGVEGDKIVVRKDTVIVKEGEVIQKPIAEVLAKLGIEPMEIGLNLIAVWEKGIIYLKDILSIPPSKYLEDLAAAHAAAFNLAFNTNYYTKDTVPLFLTKAQRQAISLAENAGIMLPETMPGLFAKAKAQHDVLEGKVKIEQESSENG